MYRKNMANRKPISSPRPPIIRGTIAPPIMAVHKIPENVP
jgi:hypothetical protein